MWRQNLEMHERSILATFHGRHPGQHPDYEYCAVRGKLTEIPKSSSEARLGSGTVGNGSHSHSVAAETSSFAFTELPHVDTGGFVMVLIFE